MLNLQKNYLEKYQQIYPQSNQWSSIQYKLQLNLGNTSAYLKRVYCVVNPYMSSQFEKENKGMIISEVYVKPENLTGSNRIQRVCQKGFQLSTEKGGLEFVMGQIQGINEINADNQEYFQLLVVKICSRKAYPCVSSQQTQSDNFRPPQGFDSIVYKQNPQDNQIYRHRFKIYKKLQTLPYYLIQFSFRKQLHEKAKIIKCQKCLNEQGNVYCFTQKVYFCKKCDYQHHKDKISSKHQRKIIIKDDPILDFGYCNNHKTNKNQLFCKVCNVSMCMSCKIYGDHSQGIMATHQLEKVKDYYEGITAKIKQMDPNLEKRKNQIQQLLHLVNNKMYQINQQTSSLQAQLKVMFQDAIRSLQAISRRKLSYLISDQLEMRRQYDYIQWMESYLKYEYNILPPHDFLTCWTKHIKLRKDVLNIANIPPVTEVKPDYKIVGQVRVEQDGKIVVVASSGSENSEKNMLNLKKQLNDAKKQIQNSDSVAGQNKQYSQFRKKLFAHGKSRQGFDPSNT